jgi:hypothetical protein
VYALTIMCMLSIRVRIRNLCIRSVHASEVTYACTEHMTTRYLTKHRQKDLKVMMSVPLRIRNLPLRWAYVICKHYELMQMLNMHIRNLK